jgi:glycosyltransferase involved in cell wall biosynthesis
MNSLIIAYYKNLPALELIFKALLVQSNKNFEVIVAEDAQDEETLKFITEWRAKVKFTIRHVSQPDQGFRKTKILNSAIKVSSYENLIFLDGDCIPHKHFIEAHTKSRTTGFALFGRRVMLSKNKSDQLLENKIPVLPNFFELKLTNAKKTKYSFYLPFIKQERDEGIWGCNWSIAKNELLAIGGFDESYVHAGIGEDVDIEWRLKENGIKLLSIRFGAIVYHLHHAENYDTVAVQKGYAILNAKKKLSAKKKNEE